MNSKYSNILTIVLVIVIIAIIGIIAFLGYKYYESSSIKNNSEDFVDSFLNESNVNNNNSHNNNNNNNNNEDNNNIQDGEVIFEGVDERPNTSTGNESSSTTGGKVQKYNGMIISGTIEIPATNVKYPIIAQSEDFNKGLESAIVEIYGNGLNKVGNTTLAGHNYRSNAFFSNNKKLSIGDKIYITDLTGKRLSYTIYNKYETEENDSEYMSRDTKGAIEISLSTCTDDSQRRLIIWAKADV